MQRGTCPVGPHTSLPVPTWGSVLRTAVDITTRCACGRLSGRQALDLHLRGQVGDGPVKRKVRKGCHVLVHGSGVLEGRGIHRVDSSASQEHRIRLDAA